jgi:hypothetical protein
MIYRQGDVLLVPIAAVPEGAKPLHPERLVIAEGEVTGHVHELVGGEVELFEGAEAVFVKIMASPEWRHAEHATQTIEPGIYEVRRQREYTPEAFRQVAD